VDFDLFGPFRRMKEAEFEVPGFPLVHVRLDGVGDSFWTVCASVLWSTDCAGNQFTEGTVWFVTM